MIIINSTDNSRVDVSLYIWRGGWDAGPEPDVLQDLAESDLNECPRDEDGNPMMSADELKAFVAWWRAEVAHANAGLDNRDGLQGLTAEEIDRGDEWMLSVE